MGTAHGVFGTPPMTLPTGLSPWGVVAGDRTRMRGLAFGRLRGVIFGVVALAALAGPATASVGFALRTDLATGSGEGTMTLADLNGDGRPDLILGNVTVHNVSVYLANGP